VQAVARAVAAWFPFRWRRSRSASFGLWRKTEDAFAERMARPESGFDAMDPANVSPLVVWLGSTESQHVTGRIFELEGGIVSVVDGYHHGPQRMKKGRWEPAELGPVVDELLGELRDPDPVYGTF
jgi:hypothetical protein